MAPSPVSMASPSPQPIHSTGRTRSRSSTQRVPLAMYCRMKASDMMMPAMKPMTTAAHGSTKAHGAVIATRPARAPLPICDTSSVLKVMSEPMVAPMTPAAAARLVLTATSAKFTPIAFRNEPGLKPIQPTHRMITPRIMSGME